MLYRRTGLPYGRPLAGSRNGQVGYWCNRCGAWIEAISEGSTAPLRRPTADELQLALRQRLLARRDLNHLKARG